jgi:geranylgeranyl reductase family protein
MDGNDGAATLRVQALVIGAGPAGSAAALTLARAGIDVALADQHGFPRDKVCGDALIPDALSALRRLGLAGEVERHARRLDGIRIYAPDRTFADVDGALACCPRYELDDVIRRAAVQAGARFLAPLRLHGFLAENESTRGALFRNGRDTSTVAVSAELVLLATGAASAPLELAGLCQRKEPAGIAVRAYFRNERLAGEFDRLIISFDHGICPGYGWIFPAPDGVFNIGAGYFFDARHRPAVGNVRRVFESFVASFPPARAVLAGAQQLSEVKGAPLRTALKGARYSRPGLLAIGEAAGTTYSFSGEGIGKALETGILAAQHAAEFLRGRGDMNALRMAYEESLRRDLAPRFAAYETAQRWLSYPRLCNFLATRARKGSFVRRELEGLLAETSDPTLLFSVRGMLRALVA